MFRPLIHHLSLLCLWLSTIALAQRECDLDGATSTYNQGGLIVPFDNLCGRDIDAALDYIWSAEQRRSDCIDRCVKQAPLCYGFDYTPYVSSSSANCWLLNGSFPASSATVRSWVADAGMLNPGFLAELPEDCKTLGLRGCFERDGGLGSGISGLATGTASLSSSATSRVSTTTAPSTVGSQQEPSAGLSTGAKAGIGAGAGLAALIAILCGVLFVLKRVKRNRTTAPSAMVQQSNTGDAYPPQKAESQIHACVATGGLELAEPRPAASAEQVHEIDGRARHEK
jgi:hypothetical protein